MIFLSLIVLCHDLGLNRCIILQRNQSALRVTLAYALIGPAHPPAMYSTKIDPSLIFVLILCLLLLSSINNQADEKLAQDAKDEQELQELIEVYKAQENELLELRARLARFMTKGAPLLPLSTKSSTKPPKAVTFQRSHR